MKRHKVDGWARVAEFMGDGLNLTQCKVRWSNYVEPRQRGLKIGNWQSDEVPHPPLLLQLLFVLIKSLLFACM